MARFVDLLLREAQLWADALVKPRTVFFGGGTPTLLPSAEMSRLITGLRNCFDFSHCVEWTIEANPATISAEYCRVLVESGVDRMSMGAQSFDRAELAILERHHEPDDVPRGLEIARAAGIRRLNLDLIYAIPGQTLQRWTHSLESAIALGTDHLSCYGLTYESNTPLAVRRRFGQVQAIEEELELEMFHATRQRLIRAGLPSYEISSYARPGQECRHNLLYWTGGNYLGLGPAAASHVQGWRWKNRPHLGEWESAIAADSLPAIDIETLSPRQRAGECAMLLLRLARGIDCAEFADQCGYDARTLFAEVIDRLGRLGLVEIDATSIRLSERGVAVADSVAAEFLNTTTF
jgi:oxygen-independent coproporphyrinogen III oxidase